MLVQGHVVIYCSVDQRLYVHGKGIRNQFEKLCGQGLSSHDFDVLCSALLPRRPAFVEFLKYAVEIESDICIPHDQCMLNCEVVSCEH